MPNLFAQSVFSTVKDVSKTACNVTSTLGKSVNVHSLKNNSRDKYMHYYTFIPFFFLTCCQCLL